MADNAKAYSFYIPAGDESLAGFIDAQSNLSMTIRLVLKAFSENYKDKYPDASTMDIKELVRNTDVDLGRLAELAAEESAERSAERKSRDGRNAEAQVPGSEKDGGEEEAEGVLGNEDDRYEPDGDTDDEDGHEEVIDISDEDDEDDEDEDSADGKKTGGEPVPDPGDMLGDPAGPADEPEIAKPAAAPEKAKPAAVPEKAKEEPERKAAKGPAQKSEARENLRRAYNEQQESRQAATLEDLNSDIQGMMGEM